MVVVHEVNVVSVDKAGELFRLVHPGQGVNIGSAADTLLREVRYCGRVLKKLTISLGVKHHF